MNKHVPSIEALFEVEKRRALASYRLGLMATEIGRNLLRFELGLDVGRRLDHISLHSDMVQQDGRVLLPASADLRGFPDQDTTYATEPMIEA